MSAYGVKADLLATGFECLQIAKRRPSEDGKAVINRALFRRFLDKTQSSARGGISTKLPKCSFFMNSLWASAICSSGKVLATRGRISPFSI